MNRWLLIALCCALAACTANVRDAGDAALVDADPAHFVVITLRNAGAAPPARAGSSPRDYGMPLQYGVGSTTRAAVAQIASEHRLEPVTQWPIAQLGVHCIVYRLGPEQAQTEVLARLRADPRVESAQPLNAFSTYASAYNDPYASLQRSLPVMGVPDAHALARGRGVTVAVIDTSADVAHADLASRAIEVRDFTGAHESGSAHGTAVTGIIAATANNLLGIVGVAPEATVVSLAACWSRSDAEVRATCNSFTLAKALAAAIDLKADVVNLSLGGPSDPLLRRLVEYGLKRGMIFVGALPTGESIGFPCDIAGVLAVDIVGHVPSARTALFAPGTDVLTLLPHDRYDFLSGSSLAAANVSGSIALLLSTHRQWNAEQVRSILAHTSAAGASINVCAALAGADASSKCASGAASAADVASVTE